ncbi:MAG: hypothetical protein R2682_04050 [Pyrinomonadaceae bacterium]
MRLVSDASPLAAGLFFVARLIPFAIMSPIAGTFVDRFSRRKVMIVTDVLRTVIASHSCWSAIRRLWDRRHLATVLLHTLGVTEQRMRPQ